MSHLLEIESLAKHFRIPRSRGGGLVYAVDDVDLAIDEGEILGLVGESGSGKSTLGQCIVRLLDPTAGRISLLGQDITHLSRRRLRPLRKTMHMVFQDPYSSLDPRMTAAQIVAEPIRMHRQARGQELRRRVGEMFERVGLSLNVRSRYPHELSGGQRQRVGLARSLILRPQLIIADEPVSALDVSVQAGIINLLMDLQRDLGFSCLFIAHDLATVEFLCQRIAVMYLGRIVETGTREQIFTAPQHPYTQSLLASAVVPDPILQRQNRGTPLQGDIPSPIDPPSGCHFHTRCPVARQPMCSSQTPRLADALSDGHRSACHLVTKDAPQPSAFVRAIDTTR